jgi:hypothetical protein
MVDAVAVMTSMERFARVIEMPAGGLIHLVNALPCRHDGFCREDGAEQQLRRVRVHTEAPEPVAGLAAATCH